MAINIFFFGDSINFGQNISVDENWVTKIGIELNKEDWGGKNQIIIQNPSVNGNTTRMALERMPFDIQSQKVDILIVTFGMNDCNYWQTDQGLPRVSPLAFEANMKEIITRGFCFGAKAVIIHTNHPSPRQDIMTGTSITYQDSNHAYNDIIRKVAKECERVDFIDIENIMFNMVMEDTYEIKDFTQKDGIHLSEVGNKIYFKNIFPIVKKCIITQFIHQ